MRIFLLWQTRNGDTPSPISIQSKLQGIFSPLFQEEPSAQIFSNAATQMVFLELPVKGWSLPFSYRDAEKWAVAIDYPLNAAKTLRENRLPFETNSVLADLGKHLSENPGRLLRKLTPPFSLVWSTKESETTYVQNDALGQSQFFEYDDGHLWVLTNKITALKALNIPVEINVIEWAVRCVLGWFPLEMSGYKNIRFLSPGTQLRINSDEIVRGHSNVLQEWVQPERLPKQDCLDLARNSLLEYVRELMPHWNTPSVGLSGGWDSRAVVSTLLFLGANFSARVRGLPERADVVIAQELARLAGFSIRHKASGGLPSEDAEGCARSISLALLWQAGHMVTHKHKSFLSNGDRLNGGVVNIMGQHGEIGRAYYSKMIHATALDPRDYETELIGRLLAKMPPVLRPRYRKIVSELIRDAYRQASEYGLKDSQALDFFYLYERTRRWASASLSSQTGVVLTPFLNPDFIRATFAFPDSKEDNPFHRFILSQNTPAWLSVPFANELKQETVAQADVETNWKRIRKHENYDSHAYWDLVGKSIIEEALRTDGLWSEIFDPKLLRANWKGVPDLIAIFHLLPQITTRDEEVLS